MRKGILLTAIVMLGMIAPAFAQSDIGVTVDATWVSKYIWRGIDLYDDKAALQPSITFDIGDTGISGGVWWSIGGSSGGGGTSLVDGEELDYFLTYSHSINEGDESQMDYAVSWIYYDYPDMASVDSDAQEFNIAIALPNVCDFGIVPKYQYVYGWDSKSPGANRKIEGSLHIFGIEYDMDVAELQNPVTFTADLVYNDGAFVDGVDHDWSHVVWGLSTSFDCPTGGVITPAIYYQTSMEDTVNPEDELWTGISYSLSF